MKAMDSRSRVFAAMSGKPVDRKPYCPLLSLYGARLTGADLKTHFTDPATFVQGQVLACSEFKPDVVAAPFSLPLFGAAFGGDLRLFADQPPNLEKSILEKTGSIKDIQVPDPDSSPELIFLRRSSELLVKELGERAVIAAPMLGPFDLPIMITGLGKWLNMVLDQGREMRRMLEISEAFFRKWLGIILATGVDAVVLPSPFMLPGIITRHIAMETVMPFLTRVYADLDTPLILHCTGARFFAFLDLVAKLPNAGGVVISQADDLMSSRRAIGHERVLFGGISAARLIDYPLEAVEILTASILDRMKDDRAFVFTLTGPDVPVGTDPGKLHAISRILKEKGMEHYGAS